MWVKDPRQLEWTDAPLPDVEDVPYDMVVVVYSPTYYGLLSPNGDTLSELRWCSSSGYPIPNRDVVWWAIVRQGGEEERPSNVKTWKEVHGMTWREACERAAKMRQIDDAG